VAERLVVPSPVRLARPRETRDQKQAVYDLVTARDGSCRAPAIAACYGLPVDACAGREERHHAGVKMGTRRVTTRHRVVLLCRHHHQELWADANDRWIVEWLKVNG
jgi:hypothetical protein